MSTRPPRALRSQSMIRASVDNLAWPFPPQAAAAMQLGRSPTTSCSPSWLTTTTTRHLPNAGSKSWTWTPFRPTSCSPSWPSAASSCRASQLLLHLLLVRSASACARPGLPGGSTTGQVSASSILEATWNGSRQAKVQRCGPFGVGTTTVWWLGRAVTGKTKERPARLSCMPRVVGGPYCILLQTEFR